MSLSDDGVPEMDLMEECDLCHEIYSINEIILTEWGQLLCKECYVGN